MKQLYVFEKKMCATWALLLVCALFGSSCTKEEDDVPAVDPENEVNTWIYKTMADYYLWNDEVEKMKPDYSLPPEEFFASLLSEEDGAIVNDQKLVFSYIEKKGEATKSSIDASDTYGFDFASLKNGNLYYAWVISVLPDSPAAKAGIKRGDWIVAVNSNSPNISNMNVLLKGGKVTFQLARYDQATKAFIASGQVAVEASRTVEDTPFLKDSVYHMNGKHIGYLMYASFTSGPADNDLTYDNQMKQLFAEFKSQQVNEFVLDLRYNGGGLVSSAQLLASLLAPAGALGKTFCEMEYNDRHQRENQTLLMKSSSELSNANLNLKRLYVLVGTPTASASEAVINCLIPYMTRANITLIGEKTVGKRVGSVTFGEKEKYDWLLHPIVLRIYNANREANYANGFTPDIPVEELVVGNTLLPFGEPDELLLSEALALITGQANRRTSVGTKSGQSVFSFPSLERKVRQGLIYQPEE